KSKKQRTQKGQRESDEQNRFPGIPFLHQSRRYRHNAVRHKERERQEPRKAYAQLKAADDIRNNWSEDIRKERNDEEDQENQDDDLVTSHRKVLKCWGVEVLMWAPCIRIPITDY